MMRKLLFLFLLLILCWVVFFGLAPKSAGLYIGPLHVANKKYAVTNPHHGYAGPRVGRTTHVNLYVWEMPENLLIHNFHISWVECAYIWDSVPQVVVYDGCGELIFSLARTGIRVDLIWAALGILASLFVLLAKHIIKEGASAV